MSKDDLKLQNQDLLEKLNLLDGTMLKRAAVLLFHRNPEKWITGSFVKIGFFETDADLRYQDEVHGSLMIQADRVIDLLYTKYLTAEISYDNITRIEHYPFPKDAVREAVFNALIHQDFSVGVPVQISAYKDKLYISNDCVFPANWTANTLMQNIARFPITRILRIHSLERALQKAGVAAQKKSAIFVKNTELPNRNIQFILMIL